MALLIIAIPVVVGALALLLPSHRYRPYILPLAAIAHSTLCIVVIVNKSYGNPKDLLYLDPPGRLILVFVSLLFLVCAFYCVGYLASHKKRPNRLFIFCLLAFESTISLVAWAQHLGLIWIGVEAMTLSIAPLIYFNKIKEAIEATWKYLLIGFVGVALALLGSFFMAYSAVPVGLAPSMKIDELIAMAPRLSAPWLKAACILLLVGFGTKMGIVPMHSWKPDAYGEAPGVVGALFAGGVTSIAFLALLRVYSICAAAFQTAFFSGILIVLGLLSMLLAGLFMIGQKDFKRILAYSSIENMGVLIIGLGLGAPALYGVMLHVVTNGSTKGLMFLAAGNIQRAYRSKNIKEVQGSLRSLPLSSGLFLAGFIAIIGTPPFGPFMSLMAILQGAFAGKNYLIIILFLGFLLLAFIGMGRTLFKLCFGRPSMGVAALKDHDSFLTAATPLVLLILVVMLGVAIPNPVADMINDAANSLTVTGSVTTQQVGYTGISSLPGLPGIPGLPGYLP